MGNNPSRFKDGKDAPRRPVEDVSWDDTQEFISKLNLNDQTDKMRFRLPSEAQWEYACRAGTKTRFYFGDSINKTQANYGRNNDGTTPVGSFPPNAFGLYDMHGNVRELVEDVYDGSFYSSAEETNKNPLCTKGPAGRVNRGGSWDGDPSFLRSAGRGGYSPGYRHSDLGLRLIRIIN